MSSSSSSICSVRSWCCRAKTRSAIFAATVGSPARPVSGRVAAQTARRWLSVRSYSASRRPAGAVTSRVLDASLHVSAVVDQATPGDAELAERLDLPGPVLRSSLSGPDERGPRRCHGVQGVALTSAAACGPVRPVDLDQVHTVRLQKPCQAGALGARPLDPDDHDPTEGPQPRKQRPVAAGVCGELRRPKLTADTFQDRSSMRVPVGVDPAPDLVARLTRHVVDLCRRCCHLETAVLWSTGWAARAGRAGGQDSDEASGQAPMRSRRLSGRCLNPGGGQPANPRQDTKSVRSRARPTAPGLHPIRTVMLGPG